MKFKDLKHILESFGFYIARCNKHWIFSNGKHSLAVPNHRGDLNVRTCKTIIKRAEKHNYETRQAQL